MKKTAAQPRRRRNRTSLADGAKLDSRLRQLIRDKKIDPARVEVTSPMGIIIWNNADWRQ